MCDKQKAPLYCHPVIWTVRQHWHTSSVILGTGFSNADKTEPNDDALWVYIYMYMRGSIQMFRWILSVEHFSKSSIHCRLNIGRTVAHIIYVQEHNPCTYNACAQCMHIQSMHIQCMHIQCMHVQCMHVQCMRIQCMHIQCMHIQRRYASPVTFPRTLTCENT